MLVHQMQTLHATPSLGALVGSITSERVISDFNAAQGGTAVLFGQAGDPYSDRYHNLMNVFNTVIAPVHIQVQAIREEITEPVYKAITCEADLMDISDNMKLPILMHKPVLELFKQDKIYGFGFDKDSLPEEDVYGRYVDNHTAEYSGDSIQEEITAEYCTTDPDFTANDIVAIGLSRQFVEEWLAKQLGPDGSRIDPTDMSNVIK